MNIKNHFLEKFQILRLVKARLCRLSEAARNLRLSYRQTFRWWKRYKAACGSLTHFVTPSPECVWNRKKPSTIQAVIDYKIAHSHRSNIHIAETITDSNEKISASTVRRTPKDRTTPSVFGQVPDRRRLESAFCFKTTRKLDKCNSFPLDGITYSIDQKFCLVNRTVDLEFTPMEIRVYHLGNFIQKLDGKMS